MSKSDKLAKLRKNLAKADIITEMNDPTCFVTTGNLTIDYKLTGGHGLPNRRPILLWGESGTGKTFLSSNIAAQVQKLGYPIVYIDTEDSISEDYMEKIGIDLSDDMFIPVIVSTVEEATKALSEIFEVFGPDDKLCLIIDSLAGLLTDSEQENFRKGVTKGDMGQLAKKLKLFVKNVNKQVSKRDAFCVMVTHAYQNQDVLNGEGKWICTGGKGFQFFPSFSIMLEKRVLKEGTEKVDGVLIRGKITKTRFAAPNQTFELKVPYTEGISRIDGFEDVLLSAGVVSKNGGWYSYEKDGETIKFQKKNLDEHVDYLHSLIKVQEVVEEKDETGA